MTERVRCKCPECTAMRLRRLQCRETEEDRRIYYNSPYYRYLVGINTWEQLFDDV